MKEALEYADSMKDPQSLQRAGLKKWLEKTADEFKTSKSLHDKIESKGLEILKHAITGPALAGYVYPYIRDGSQVENLHKLVEDMINKLLDNFKKSPGQQAALDRFIKDLLTRAVEDEHAVIGRLVRDKLESFSNEMLVDLIEDKAGDDLQIIRINGSVVGGIVGMALYLLTFWI